MVLLMFGARRGGGSDGLVPDTGTGGFYYLLDVTIPDVPKLVWRINNTLLPEHPMPNSANWSEPKIVKMVTSSGNKLVAVVGGGYDNLNEDGRYGATQTFLGSSYVSVFDTGRSGTSTGLLDPYNPVGNGIYVIEIARIRSKQVHPPSTSRPAARKYGNT